MAVWSPCQDRSRLSPPLKPASPETVSHFNSEHFTAGLHSSTVSWPDSGGHSTMVPLLGSHSMQTGEVSGHRHTAAKWELLPAYAHWRKQGGGGCIVNRMSRSLSNPRVAQRNGNWVSGFHQLDSANGNSHPMGFANNRTAVANSVIWCYFSALLDPSLSKYRHLPNGEVQTVSLICNEVYLHPTQLNFLFF